MAQRALSAILALAVISLVGCGKPKAESTKKKESGEAARQAWQRDAKSMPTGIGRTELEQIAVNCSQLQKLVGRNKLPFPAIEALGWRIHHKARNLVDGFEHRRREKALADESKVVKLKEEEAPEHGWTKWPAPVRDLDRVAINAKSIAVAAANWNAGLVRERFASLRKVAVRCLPVVAPSVAERTPAEPAGK